MSTKPVIQDQRAAVAAAAAERGDVQASAAAEMARARADIEARYILADRRPRNWETVRTLALQAAARPQWAATGLYSVPVGKDKHGNAIKASGLSIRAAEELHRAAGNLEIVKSCLHIDAEREIWRVRGVDLETNAAHACDVVVTRQIERRYLKEDQTPIAVRTNANGQTVYIVESDETTMRRKRAAEMARAKREAVLALIPSWIREDFEAAIRATTAKATAADPRAARTAILDSFAGLGVTPDQLQAYVGKPLEQLRPDDLSELRGLWTAIRDGEISWPEAVKRKAKASGADPDPGPDPDPEEDVPTKAELLSMLTKQLGAAAAKTEIADVVGADWAKRDWTIEERNAVWAKVG